MDYLLWSSFSPSSTAKCIGCWQAVTVHTWATQLCRKWKDFWWLVDHANHSVNCWISHVTQPLCGNLLGKQAASTQCHPQFGRGSHMTPRGWPWYSLLVCLLTSHSSCQPVMKLKCQHRRTHPHTQPCHPCGSRSALWHCSSMAYTLKHEQRVTAGQIVLWVQYLTLSHTLYPHNLPA